ncbi:G4 quadruplex nucleic acid binding protein [Coemansia sp. RSA 988]|nr:G4 quadruplex nucleic acid binding protein [Coemansia sp. RSA 988]
MSLFISSSDAALKLLLTFVPEAEKDLSVDAVADRLSRLELGSKSVEGTNAVAQTLAAKYDSALAGSSDADRADISQWMTMSARHGPVERQAFSQLIDSHLAQRTFLVGDRLSLADLVAFGNVHAFMGSLSSQKRFALCNFSRWFDLVQHTLPAGSLEKAGLDMVAIDLRAPAPPKKQVAQASAAAKKPECDAASEGKQQQQQKQKKDKQKQKPEKKQAPTAKDVVIVPSMIDLRVGHIVDVEKHPDADALYVEKIDAGEDELRTVVSGLVRFVPIEQMRDRDVVLVCNLKPAKMRGVMSHAMVLCATSPDGATVEFVEPPKGSKPGDRVYFDGFDDGKPEELLKPKMKVFETIQPGLFTNDHREAGWYDADKSFHKLLVSGAVCTTATVVNGSLK